jgi:hypothetical protein
VHLDEGDDLLTPSFAVPAHDERVRHPRMGASTVSTSSTNTFSPPVFTTSESRPNNRDAARETTWTGLPLRLNSSAASSSTAFERPTTTTRVPSSARQRAVASPMPRPPPTTTAVALAKPRSTA